MCLAILGGLEVDLMTFRGVHMSLNTSSLKSREQHEFDRNLESENVRKNMPENDRKLKAENVPKKC